MLLVLMAVIRLAVGPGHRGGAFYLLVSGVACLLITDTIYGWMVANLPGGYILAVSHLSHVEPALVGALMDRKVDWMSRIEFYRYHICAAVLNAIHG